MNNRGGYTTNTLYRDPTTGFEESAVFIALAYRKFKIVKYLAGLHETDVNTANDLGYTALHLAAGSIYFLIFNLFIEQKF